MGRRTRNRTRDGDNLRLYRTHKVSKGQRRIKTKRYRYRQYDLVIYNGAPCIVVGVQNKGAYIRLRGHQKVVSTKKAIPLYRAGGICYAA